MIFGKENASPSWEAARAVSPPRSRFVDEVSMMSSCTNARLKSDRTWGVGLISTEARARCANWDWRTRTRRRRMIYDASSRDARTVDNGCLMFACMR